MTEQSKRRLPLKVSYRGLQLSAESEALLEKAMDRVDTDDPDEALRQALRHFLNETRPRKSCRDPVHDDFRSGVDTSPSLFFSYCPPEPFFDSQGRDLPTPAVASAMGRARRAWISPRRNPFFYKKEDCPETRRKAG